MTTLSKSGSRKGILMITVAALGLQGCASLSRTEEGAIGGAAVGAAVGAMISDNTAKGVILGAVIGGAAGAAIGRVMDEQAEDLQDKLPNATVERVGEGIQVTFASGILFDVDSDQLRTEARDNLRQLAESLKDYEGTDVLVVGHTDATGSDAYNQALSERRSASARSFLLGAGLAGDRVEAAGRGETEPVASNESLEGRQAIAIFASEEMQQRMIRENRGEVEPAA
jgi:outer membrane protein OmpA-like peptidoglycan-associated protein